MDNILTSSVIIPDEEQFQAFAQALSEYESDLELQDIAVLEEYANILFDCTSANTEKLMNIMRSEHSDIYWRWMLSDSETVKSIAVYDKNGFVTENINKTMDQIAEDSAYSCSGSCSECSSDCTHGADCSHDDKCSCSSCKHDDFSLDDNIDMLNEIAKNGEGDEFFSTLVRAFLQELTNFVNEQTQDSEQAGDAYDVFLNMLNIIIISAAACDGSYSLREHEYIEQLTGELDFERTKRGIPDIVPNDEEICKAMSYWYDAQSCGCNIRKYVLLLCTYLCCADAPVNKAEHDFLKMLEQAR